jgi:hypothetical protein
MQGTHFDAQGNLNVMDDRRCFNMSWDLHPYAPISMANEQGVERVKGFYINGILTSSAQGSNVIREIADLLIAGRPRAEINLELHYNDTFNSPWKVVTLPTLQLKKLQSGQELAEKIQQSLNSGFGRVVVIAHSQGTDIANIVKGFLSEEELARVGFISLGAKSQFEGGVNLRYESDLIAKIAQFFSGGSVASGNIVLRKDRRWCITNFCHGTTDYLSHPIARQNVSSAFAPSADSSKRTWLRLSN